MKIKLNNSTPYTQYAAQYKDVDLSEIQLNGERIWYSCFLYTPDGDGYSVSAREGVDILSELVIPSKYNNKEVISINAGAFKNCSNLTSVTIPDSVTTIGDSAFYNCPNLTSVAIGNSVTTIGNNAFYNCDSLTSITIPDSVTTIGNNAFAWCEGLTEIVIPDSVMTIGNAAFTCCSNLTSVTIGNSVTFIGNSAFFSCSKLTSVVIGDSVTTISSVAFQNCDSLTSITIPDSVTSIGYRAFYGCSSLATVVIPDSVTSIGNQAFYGCTNLKTVTIGSGVTTIGEYTFYDCSSLKSVTMSSGVTSIGDCAFYNCSSLVRIGKFDNVDTIGEYAFKNCTSLEAIETNDNGKNHIYASEIDIYAFEGCTNLKFVIIFNTSIVDELLIGYNFTYTFDIFYYYDEERWYDNGGSSYENVYFYSESEPTTEGNYWQYDNYGIPFKWYSSCANGHDYYNKVTSPTCTEEGYTTSTCRACQYTYTHSYVEALGHTWGDWMPKEGEQKEYRECSACGEVEERDPVLLYELLEDGTYAVATTANASSVEVITIPSTYNNVAVTKIKDYAFEGITSLREITIPDSITHIGFGAFAYCSMLTNVNIGANSQLVYIGEEAFYECTELSTIYLPDSLETIGDGAFALSFISTIAIPDNVTSIGNECFYDSYLRQIAFGANSKLSTIWERAFVNCELMTEITIPNEVTYIGERAFDDCHNLTTVTFAEGSKLHSIMDRAFRGCGLTSITLPEGCSYILDGAFSQCTNLAEINLPSTLLSVGEESASSVFYNTAYYNNESNWSDGVLYIGKWLIAVKSTVTEVEVASSCNSVSTGAIRDWTHAAAIKIPLSVTNIQPLAFASCANLTVYCEAESKPDGWVDNWCDDSVEVVWGYTEESCTHDYIVTENVPSTCTTMGYTIYTCSKCGHRRISYAKTLKHFYGDWELIVEPTCTRFGTRERYCTICGATDVGIVPTVNHSYGDWTITTAPTCTEHGTQERHCSVCGATDVGFIPALGHNYELLVVKPTCTTRGYTKYTCSACGDSYTDNYTNALGHLYRTMIVDPTCTEQGYTSHTCARCGDTYKDNYTEALGHTWIDATCETPKTCSVCGATEGEPLGHSYGAWITTTQPTCTTFGSMKRTCSVCDNVEITPIEPLGHNYKSEVTPPTCTAQGYTTHTCSRCNDTYKDSYTDALGHKYSSVVTAPTCTAKGYTTYTCSVCNHIYTGNEVAATGHSFTPATCTTPKTCTKCGLTEGQAVGHSWVDATCTTPKTCSRCGETIGEALGHDWGEWTSNDDRTHSRICRNDATHIETELCSYSKVVTAPTCTAKGYTTYTCTRCSYSYKDNYTNATGHSWNTPTYSWNTDKTSCTATRTCKNNPSHTETATATITNAVTTAATCTTAGVRTYTAAFSASWAATQTATTSIPATGHSWNTATYSWSSDNSTCTATRTCKLDSSHKQIARGNVTNKVTTAATCTADGTRTYYASFEETWAASQSKAVTIPKTGHTEVIDPAIIATCTTNGKTAGSHCSVCHTILTPQQTIPAIGHDWNDITYSWSDYSSCTATRTCKNDSSHKETVTATITSSVTKEATCSATGIKKYIAKFSETWATAQTKDETLAKLAHGTKVIIPAIAATCTTAGWTSGTKCADCGEMIDAPVRIPETGHTAGDWEITVQPTTTSTGTRVKKCTSCGAVLETETIPMIDNSTYLVTESDDFLTDEQGNYLTLESIYSFSLTYGTGISLVGLYTNTISATETKTISVTTSAGYTPSARVTNAEYTLAKNNLNYTLTVFNPTGDVTVALSARKDNTTT